LVWNGCRFEAGSVVIRVKNENSAQKGRLMRYTLLLHYPEATAEDIGQEAIEAGMAAFHAYAEPLDDAGVLVSAEVLQPVANSTTVTLKNGRSQV
jgi:hypothetical protein